MTATSGSFVKVVVLCTAWYFVSSANNVIGKIVLNDFPYPMTISIVQLMSITFYLIPLLKLWKIPSATTLPVKYWFTMIIPLAAGKFLSSVSSHISIWKVSVSYAHTVKATLPFFTIVLSRIILKERQTTAVYLSIVPIIGGVLVATATELSFNLEGLLSALAATLGFSLQNIFSKKCLSDTGIHHLRLLHTLALICIIGFTPLWLYFDVTQIFSDTALISSTHTPRLILLILIDGALNFAQNMIAFSIIALLAPLSYAVANATKRICVISASLITLRNPVTWANLLGMFIAVLGVLMYNKAKYDQRQAEKRRKLLPLTTDKNLVTSTHHNGYVSDYTLALADKIAKASEQRTSPVTTDVRQLTEDSHEFGRGPVRVDALPSSSSSHFRTDPLATARQNMMLFEARAAAPFTSSVESVHNMLRVPSSAGFPKGYSTVNLDQMT